MFKFWKRRDRRESVVPIAREELRQLLADALEGQRQELARELEVRAREQVSALLDPVREIQQSTGEAQAKALAGIGELRTEVRAMIQGLEGRVVAVEKQVEHGSASLLRLEEGIETVGKELARQATHLERAEEIMRESQRVGEERIAELSRAHDAALERLAVESQKRALLEDQLVAASRDIGSISASMSKSSQVSLEVSAEETSDKRLTRRVVEAVSRPWRFAQRHLRVRQRALELERSFAEHEVHLASVRRRLSAVSGSAPEAVAIARSDGAGGVRSMMPRPLPRSLAGALGSTGIAAQPSKAMS